MKRIAVITVLMVFAIFTVAAFGASPLAKVRVVNTTALSKVDTLDDAGLVKIANLSMAQNPRIFPAIESLAFVVGKKSAEYVPDVTMPAGNMELSGSLAEKEKLEFISIPYSDRPGKFDVAVVSRDGSVKHIDDEVVIDYAKGTITAPKGFKVSDGDVVLIFTKDIEKITFGGDNPNETGYHQPNTENNHLLTHGGNGGGNGGGGNGR